MFRSAGFTLVEVLIVVVIMAVLSATVIPSFMDVTTDAKESSVKHNLSVLRSQIGLYQHYHNGDLPSKTLVELITSTNAEGLQGTGEKFPYGPYVAAIPENSFTGANTVVSITNSPAQETDVTDGDGWLYNATTGEIWINHVEYFQQ